MSCWPFLKHFPFVSNHHKILFGSRPELGVLSHGLTLATGAIPFTINHATYCLCCLKTKQNHKKETKLSEHLKTSLHILFDAWCKQNMVTELGDRYRIRRQNMLTWNRWKTPMRLGLKREKQFWIPITMQFNKIPKCSPFEKYHKTSYSKVILLI